MNANPHWSRWLISSLASHFETLRLLANEIPIYLDGQRRPHNIENYALLRFEGPFFNEINKHYWKIEIIPYLIINIVQNDEDIYRLDRILGNYASLFYRDIPIFRFGDNSSVDDGTQLGCLTLVSDFMERIRIDKLGQLQAATPVATATIEARYRMGVNYGDD